MKGKLLLILLSFYSLTLRSQTVFFEQDFNKFQNYAISGWNTTSYSGKVPWSAGPLYLVNGECFGYYLPNSTTYNYVAGISDCGRINYNNNNVLMYTPAINFTGHSRVVLKFDSYFPKYTNGIYTEKATVEVSINGGASWNEVANLSPNPVLSEFLPIYIDLSVYNVYSDVRIAFRYSDNGGHMAGWAIDNVAVFEPSQKDLRLMSVTPEETFTSYAKVNTGIPHVFKVANMGLDTVTEFTINYRQGNGPVKTDTIRNVSIPKFTTLHYTHKVPDTVLAIGSHDVVAWVDLPGDNQHWNDSARTVINGASFMPHKIVALEEGTGTWCGFCIPGIVYMNKLSAGGYHVCQVAVHDGDPMATSTAKPYSDYLFNIDQNYVPYFLLDRRHAVMNKDSIFSEIKRREAYFGFADIQIIPKIEGNSFKVTANVTPAVDLKGEYRLILVLTEDDVSGIGNGWDQRNSYSGGAWGPMGGYENMPNPVAAKNMKYQYVARAVYPSAEGVTNLPTTMEHSKMYTVNFDQPLNIDWNINKLRANVFLIRHEDSLILNTNKVLFYLDVKDKEGLFSTAYLYPNPATESTTLEFVTTTKEELLVQVTDISGRVLLDKGIKTFESGKNSIDIKTAGLSQGIYLVNLISAKGRKTLKLQVMH